MNEMTQELFDEIKHKLGCTGILLIATDSQIPCPDSRAGEECNHDHKVISAVDNMSVTAAAALVAEVLTNASKQN